MKIRLRHFLPLILSLAACALPGGLSTPITLPTTPAPATSSPAAASPRRFFTETFDADPRDWLLTQTNGDPNLFRNFIESGRWDFLLNGEYIYAYAIYEPTTYREVRLDLRVFNQESNRNLVSLICHFNLEKGWYEFAISPEGTYRILHAQWDAQADEAVYVTLADGISAVILPGRSENTYSAICSGTYLTLLVNGIQLAAFNEEEYGLNNGQIGLGVSSFESLPVRVEFDSLTVSQPE